MLLVTLPILLLEGWEKMKPALQIQLYLDIPLAKEARQGDSLRNRRHVKPGLLGLAVLLRQDAQTGVVTCIQRDRQKLPPEACRGKCLVSSPRPSSPASCMVESSHTLKEEPQLLLGSAL